MVASACHLCSGAHVVFACPTAPAGTRLLWVAAELGYEVLFVDAVRRRRGDRPTPEGYFCSGYTDYERRLIQIAKDRQPAMLLVLAHEIGHALAARRMGIDRMPPGKRRWARTTERRAYLYGWAVLRMVAAEIVTREVWRDFHDDVPGLSLVPARLLAMRGKA